MQLTLRAAFSFLFVAAMAARLCASQEVLRAPNNDAMAWRWDARFVSFSTSNEGTRNEFDNPQVIERRILELKKLGITVIQLNGLHERNVYLDRFPMLLRTAKMICDIAHKHGMYVIEHSDVTIVPYRNQTAYGYKLLLRNFDWFQRDVQFDHLINNPCINNPGFKEHYFDMITEYVKKTGVDGLKLDEIIFARGRACGCPHCRAKFTRDTGEVIPDDHTDPFFKSRGSGPGATFTNVNDRRLLKWLRWRNETIGDWHIALRKAVNKVSPNVSFVKYTTHYGLTSPYSTFGSGGSIFQAARSCDWLGTEIMSRNVYYCPRAVFMYRKMFAGLGEWADTPVYGLVYHCENADTAKMGWALNVMHRELPLMATIEGADMSYIGWQDKMANRDAHPVADIAVLFSDNTRNWERMAGYLPDTAGYSECMSDAHIQHVFLMEQGLSLEKLKRYNLLILPSTSCVGTELAQVIRDYVKQGGRLLITGHASLLDELGFPREDFALADIMNVKYRGGWAPKGCNLRRGDEIIPLSGRGLHVKCVDPQRSRVVAELVDAKGKVWGPAIVETKFGKGTVIYDACRLGTYNYARERTVGDKFNFERNETMHRLLVELVRRAYGGKLSFEAAASMPDKVFVTVYRQRANGREQVLVHLLNATGSDIRAGETVPKTTPENAWPVLKEDLEFEIELAGFADARVVSPDFQGPRPVRVTSAGNRHRVVVNKGDLKWFSTVYFTLK